MTPEEKHQDSTYIINERFIAAMLAMKDFKILQKQDSTTLFDNKIREVLKIIETREKDDQDMIKWDFFLYGYICGKRADRARRKHKDRE